jgi:hypothetical protein
MSSVQIRPPRPDHLCKTPIVPLVRAGVVKRIAGFDGEYGRVRVFDEEEKKNH